MQNYGFLEINSPTFVAKNYSHGKWSDSEGPL